MLTPGRALSQRARTRVSLLLALVLALQGPVAFKDLTDQLSLILLMLPLLYGVDLVLRSTPTWHPLLLISGLAFGAEEIYSNLALAGVHAARGDAAGFVADDPGQLLLHHVAAIALAVAVGLLVAGVRIARRTVREAILFVTLAASPIPVARTVLVADRERPVRPAVVENHHGCRAPPRLKAATC